jgi:diaminohydroxyphosphoribosylaminopyrimidine deaminase / 5-amino-6-(5-phosphoribosylamino)uracil reductase
VGYHREVELAAVATEQDRVHMRRALELAVRGRGRVSPNPLVGAVLVRDGEPIGEGFHAELGGAHAEVAALEDCRARSGDPAGATLFVSLEPCAHRGRTPPCTDAIVSAGVARVVIGSDDPTEKASGRGPGILRDEGVEVSFASGEEAAAARLLNQAFRKHARTGRPLVTFKSALTLDGRVAPRAGGARWISGERSRALVHEWRAETDAIAVGIGTALADDPLLTARPSGPASPRMPPQPRRVIFDSAARLPLDSALVESISDAELIVVASPDAPGDRVGALREAGAEVIAVGGEGPDRVRSALTELGRREITSLMLEGGPTLAGAFHDAGEVDELRLFIAPRVLGAGRSAIEGAGAGENALSIDWERVGDDLLVSARLREW